MGFFGKLFGGGKKREEEREIEIKEKYVKEEIFPPATSQYEEDEPEPFISLEPNKQIVEWIKAGRFQILDVRTPYEYESHRILGSVLIPLKQLPDRWGEIDPSRETLVVCEHGIRSADACYFLGERGFEKIYHLEGGLSAYPGPLEATEVYGERE